MPSAPTRLMSRFALFAFSILLFCSFTQSKPNRWTQKLQECAEANNYRKFGKVAKNALQKGYSHKSLDALIIDLKLDQLYKAFKATKAIMRHCPKNGLSMPELFEMAVYIETEMQTQVQNGKTYFSRNTTDLARSIQVDPETKKVFIHLKNHGVCTLGQGARKKVSLSIYYSVKKPELLAHCSTTYQIDNEIKAARKLRGKPGLQKTRAVLMRQCKDGRIIHSLMTKLYTGGDLHGYMTKNRKKLTLRKKLKLAHNILVGIESMHKEKYAHRDLGLHNYFLDVRKKGKHKKFVAVVGDFGRAVKDGNTKERGAQGGLSQLAPEGIAYDRLTGEDYFYTDIYALGCAFFRIMHGKKAPWQDVEMMANRNVAVDKRIAKAKKNVGQYWKARLKQQTKKLRARRLPRALWKFERMISKMCDPEQANRPNATKVRKRLEKIIRES